MKDNISNQEKNLKIVELPIPLRAITDIEIPAGAKILSVMIIGGTPKVCMLLDTNEKITEKVRIYLYSTNQTPLEFQDPPDYLNSFEVKTRKGTYTIHAWYSKKSIIVPFRNLDGEKTA